jgi:glycosyltransferase involved in cell wall biosynthesis
MGMNVTTREHLIISDIPTPWREPVFERVYERLGGTVDVIYFRNNEKRRLWTFGMGQHPKTILKGISLTASSTERFLNPQIVPLLLRRRPRVALVTASIKDPSAWLALATCRFLGTKVALIADTWIGRDRDVHSIQRWARKIVYRQYGDAYIGASRKTLAMFRHYNPTIRDEQCFLSHLVADNELFDRRLIANRRERRYDVMFAGRIVPVKNPAFFAEVCAGIKAAMGACRVLIIGEGDEQLKKQMRDVFDAHGVSYDFAGFISHEALPDYYAQSRLLLFPTSGDCWGVVINEAMAAGTPVITSDLTAAAGELVLDGRNGYVLPLSVYTWVSTATRILSNQSAWTALSECARRTVHEFNYDTAATGILDAFNYLKASTPTPRLRDRRSMDEQSPTQ